MKYFIFTIITLFSFLSISAEKSFWEQGLREPFGNFKISKEMPRVQLDAVYGIRETIDTVGKVVTTGTYTVSDALTGNEYKISTGTSSTGASYLYSHRGLRYRAGEGATIRLTGRFTGSYANSKQLVGGYNKGNWLGFGYNGTSFGIWHRAGGRQEVRTLTITGAPAGAETATVTLNGTATNIAVTSGTFSHAVHQLSQGTYSGWTVTGNGSTLVFVSNTIGATTGSFGLSSTGALAGTFSRTVAGQDFQTSSHVPQSQWNVRKLNGSVTTDPFVLNPLNAKGNVYQTAFQYLGYGAMYFYVENPLNGELIHVHTILNANNVSGPTLDNPTFKIGWLVENSGNTSNIDLYGASAAGFVNGEFIPFRNPIGHLSSKSGVGTSFTNLLTIRVRSIHNGRVNLADVFPYLLTVSTDGTKPGELKLVLGAVLAGEPNWTYKDANLSSIEYDTTGTTVTNGQEILSISLPKAGDQIVNLKDLDIRLDDGATLTVAGRATASTQDLTTSLVWLED